MSKPAPRRGARPRRAAPPEGMLARRTAIDALVRIETEGAYANLVANSILDRSEMEDRDRHFVTALVYGTTRMRRACDFLIARHRDGAVTDRVGAALRLGAFQLAFGGVPAHAAVDATVAATSRPARGLVNAVLRRVAADVKAGVVWPDEATRLSYPDWIVAELSATVGADAASTALAAMNEAAITHTREDGYIQDLASQAVIAAVDAGPGHRVLDVCAAPGGKATGMATAGARVVAADRSSTRSRLVAANARRFDTTVAAIASDGIAIPFRPESFDRVLVDAPCSGFGVLRRRPDARWRIDPEAPERLATLQRALLVEAATAVAPGGKLVYSVCTLTRAENADVVDRVRLPADFVEIDRQTLLPDPEADGMFICQWQRQLGGSVAR